MGIFDLFKPNVKKLERKKNVKGLIKAMRYKKDYEVRWQAARALGKIGDRRIGDGRAVEPLIKVIEDKGENNDVRMNAAWALGEIGDGRAVEPLIKVIEDKGENNDVRMNAAWALGKIGDARILLGKNVLNQWMAAEALGKIGDAKDSINAYTFFLKVMAGEALGKIEDARAIEPLIQALKDEDSKSEEKLERKNLGFTEKIKDYILKLRVKGLVKALRYKEDCEDREKAAIALGEVGDTRAVEPLIQALIYDLPAVQGRAAEALGKIGDTRAVEPLIQFLTGGGYWYGKSQAAEALGRIGDRRAVKPLIKALRYENEVPEKAAIALVDIGKPAVEPLIEILKDTNSNVRSHAAEALGRIRDARAVEPLIQALKDKESNDVRWKAAEALGRIGDARAAEPLIQALNKESNDNVRWKAAEAVVTIKAPRGVDPLIKVLEDKGENNDVRMSAARALSEIKDARAVESLIKVLEDESWDGRKAAAYALGTIGDARAVEPLINALEDKNWDGRKAAAYALGTIGDARAVEPLIKALEDKNWDAREAAAQALGTIGDARAVEPLIKAAKSITDEAVKALCKIGDKRGAAVIIDMLSSSPFEYDDRMKDLAVFRNLFEHFTDIIFEVFSYQDSPRCSDGSYGGHHYSTSRSDASIEKLRRIHSPISTNLLHKVTQKRDINVTLHVSDCDNSAVYGTLSFEAQRLSAKRELELRGDPPYNSSAYLDTSWKL